MLLYSKIHFVPDNIKHLRIYDVDIKASWQSIMDSMTKTNTVQRHCGKINHDIIKLMLLRKIYWSLR